MRHRNCLAILALLPALFCVTTLALTASTDPRIDNARVFYEQHNYRAALDLMEKYLRANPGAADATEARVIVARCQLKLRQWEEGIKTLQALLSEHKDLNNQPVLHEELAEAARTQYQHRHLAIDHFGQAADLYEAQGQKEMAAKVLLTQASVFSGFDDWDKLEWFKLPDGFDRPTDWSELRRTQRRFAIEAVNRAIALSDGTELHIDTMMAKARMLEREFRIEEQDTDAALAIYERIAEEHAGSPQAAEALYRCGDLYDQSKQDYVAAVAAFRKMIEKYPDSPLAENAGRRLAQITKPEISLGVSGPVQSGERAKFQYHSRNVKRIEFEARRVDLFELIKQRRWLQRLEDYQPSGGSVASWSLEIPDTGEHKLFHSQDKSHPVAEFPVEEPGAYFVMARSADGEASASTLVVVSDLVGISKAARNSTLVVAADGTTGTPLEGVEVQVQCHRGKDEYTYYTGSTDAEGRYAWSSDKQNEGRNTALVVILRNGENYAVCSSSFYWYWWGYDGVYRAYTMTERPVYRPDQVVHYKSTLRNYQQGTYSNAPNTPVTIQVFDSRNQVIDRQEMRTNEEGSVSGEVRLPDDCPLGMYRITLRVDNKDIPPDGMAEFRVEEYRKPEFEVTVTADQPSYRIGESVEARIEARYYFGSPVAGAELSGTIYRSRFQPRFERPNPYPWYFEGMPRRIGLSYMPPYYPHRMQRDLLTTFTAETDENGVAIVRIQADPLEDDPEADLNFEVHVEATDVSRRTIEGSGQIRATHAPFFLHLSPQRSIYQPGDTVKITVESKSPNGDAVPFAGSWTVHKLEREVEGDKTEYSQGEKVHQDAVQSGQDGTVLLSWPVNQEGPYRVSVVAETNDKPVTASTDVWIAEKGGRFEHYAYRDLELTVDRESYAPGDTMQVLITTRFDDGYVWLTRESDVLLDERIVRVSKGSLLVELPVEVQHTPNFQMTASLIRDFTVFQDILPIVVPPTDRFLNVAIDAPEGPFLPQQSTSVSIQTTDSAGQPAPAELAVMLVDSSIYYIQPELRDPIEQHFYGRMRPYLVRTQTSFDFGSAPMVPRSERMRGMAAFADAEAAAPQAMAETAVVGRELAKEDAPGSPEEFASPTIRKDFPDTVVWLAHAATDVGGRVQVEVPFPDTLTTWRLHAVAIDRDTRVGQNSIDMITRKGVIVRLQAPRFLVEGDEPTLTVIARNDLDGEKTVRVSLTATSEIELGTPRSAGQLNAEGEVFLLIPPGQQMTVDYPARALGTGQATLVASAAANEDADAIEITVPVVPYGADRFVAYSSSIRGPESALTQRFNFEIPAEIDPDTPLMEIRLNPSIAATMIDALPYLLSYPYGCTEQTMSRFLPAVMTRSTLGRLGISLEDIRERLEGQADPQQQHMIERLNKNPVFNNAILDDMIDTGLGRLTDMQNSDGGWGWWPGGTSNPYMTAYVVYGLAEAAKAGVAVDQDMVRRGAEFLAKRLANPAPASRYNFGEDDDNVRTWMVFALGVFDEGYLGSDKVRPVVDRVYEARDGLTDYSRAMLLMVLHKMGDAERTKRLVENLYNTVRIDPDSGTASWGQASNYWYWYDNGVEATAMVLRALLVAQPEHEYVPQAVNWLVRNRRGRRWYSTKDTAFAVYALADYLAVSKELSPRMTVDVTIDDRISRSFAVTPENALTFDAVMLVSPEVLTPGTHSVAITRTGTGNVYYAAYLDYFTREDPIPPAGNEVYVTREYYRLHPKQVEKTRRVWDAGKRRYVDEKYSDIDYDRERIEDGQALASGDLLDVELTLDARNNFEYMIVEDPKPAGCEPVKLVSGPDYAQAPFVNIEMRDRMTAFFATYLSQDKHTLSYRVRCETPGLFHALPTRVEAMYAPMVRSNGGSDKLTIEDQKAE